MYAGRNRKFFTNNSRFEQLGESTDKPRSNYDEASLAHDLN
jgi:hypothetical protein